MQRQGGLLCAQAARQTQSSPVQSACCLPQNPAPNPSFEPTPTGKPAVAAQVKRWAMQMQIPSCLRSTSVAAAERGGSFFSGCSPFGSQRRVAAPRSGWRGKGVGGLNVIRSRRYSNTPVAFASAGCPSCGGQRTCEGGSRTTRTGGSAFLGFIQHRRAFASGLAHSISVALGPPNPSVKRTCLRHAAYLKR